MKELLNRRYAANRYSLKRILLALGLTVLGLMIFTSIYDGVKEGGDLASFDKPVLAWLVGSRNPLSTSILQTVTSITSPKGMVIIITASAIFWAWRSREYWRPLLLMGSMALAVSLSSSIKILTSRVRPPRINMIAPFEVNYSFPSGHTLGISVALLVAGYLIFSRRPGKKAIVAWAVVSILGIILVATSRLYLGYHWITDVSASVGLALVILAVVILIDPLKPSRVRKPKAYEDTAR